VKEGAGSVEMGSVFDGMTWIVASSGEYITYPCEIILISSSLQL
jgi:hypothetical protein